MSATSVCVTTFCHLLIFWPVLLQFNDRLLFYQCFFFGGAPFVLIIVGSPTFLMEEDPPNVCVFPFFCILSVSFIIVSMTSWESKLFVEATSHKLLEATTKEARWAC